MDAVWASGQVDPWLWDNSPPHNNSILFLIFYSEVNKWFQGNTKYNAISRISPIFMFFRVVRDHKQVKISYWLNINWESIVLALDMGERLDVCHLNFLVNMWIIVSYSLMGISIYFFPVYLFPCHTHPQRDIYCHKILGWINASLSPWYLV